MESKVKVMVQVLANPGVETFTLHGARLGAPSEATHMSRAVDDAM